MNNLAAIAEKTNNDVIVWTIVIIIGIIIAFPIYKAFIKAAKEKREYYAQEKQLLIDVVKENTQAMTKLTTYMENDTDRCKTFEGSLQHQLDKVEDKLEKVYLITNEIYDIIIENLEEDKKVKSRKED